MGNKKPSQPKEPNRQIRIDEDFLRKLRMVCEGLRIEPKDYIRDRLEPIVDDELKAVIDGMNLGEKGKGNDQG